MTMKPPRRFDTLIQAFLDNVQQNAANTSRRFEAQEQMDFTREQAEDSRAFAREQYNTQRQDYVADRQEDRTNSLTDQAREIRRSRANAILGNLWAVSTDNPNFANYATLVATLNAPWDRVGDDAMREALNETTTLIGPDGQPMVVPIDVAIGQLNGEVKAADRANASRDYLFSEGLKVVTNMSLDSSIRAARATGLFFMPGMTDDLKQSLLATMGITDEGAMKEIENQRAITAQQVELGAINIQRGQVALQREAAEFHVYSRLADFLVENQQLQNRQLAQQLGLNDMDAWAKIGALPGTPEAKQALANMVTGGDVDLLEQRAMKNYNYFGRNRAAALSLAEATATTAGIDIDKARLDVRIAQHNFNRTKAYEDLNDIQAAMASAAAAAANGDVETLQNLIALQDAYPNTLGKVGLEQFLKQAQTIRLDNEDVMRTAAIGREYSVTTAALKAATDADDYIARFAADFAPLAIDANYDPATNTYPELEAALDQWASSISDTDANRIAGVASGGREILRQRLAEAVSRQKAKNLLDSDRTTLATLLEHPPAQDDLAARVQWATQVENISSRLGMNKDEWASIAKGVLAGTDVEWNLKEAQARLYQQQADREYQNTIGQYIDNLTGWWDYEKLKAGVSGMSVQTISDLVKLYTQTGAEARAFAESPMCNLGSAEEERFGGNEGMSFRRDAQGGKCGEMSDIATNSAYMTQMLLAGIFTDNDGNRTFDPIAAQGQGGSGMPSGGVSNYDGPTAIANIRAYLSDSGQDPDSFDANLFSTFAPEDQFIIARDITQYGADPKDAMDTVIGLIATGVPGAFSPPRTVRPLASMGIDMRSPQWQAMPLDAKIGRVRNTAEWQEISAKIAEVAVGSAELSASNNPAFDILNPQTQEAAAAFQAVFGEGVTPEQAQAQLARQFGLSSSWAPGRTAPNVGFTQEVGAGYVTGPEAQPGGPRYVTGPQPQQGGPAYSTARPADEGPPVQGAEYPAISEMPAISKALSEDASLALQRAQDSIRQQLRDVAAQSEANRRTAALVTPNAPAETESAATGMPPLAGAPGMATSRGSGGTGDYSRVGQSAPANIPTASVNAPPAGPARPAANLTTSDDGFQRIRNEEGFRAEAYMDGGSWAVGYGQHGPNIKEGTTVTQEEAERLLKNHVAGVEATIRGSVQVPLNQNQYNALVSFVYNVGGPAFQRSDVLKKLNAGDYQGAADAMLAHNTSEGEVHSGLVERRQRERALFLSPGSQPAEEPEGSSAANPIERWNRTSSARA